MRVAAAGRPLVAVAGRIGGPWSTGSIFPSVDAASAFFAAGALGYSPSRRVGRLDGLRLASECWQVEPLLVDAVASAWLDDRAIFPAGSATYDCTLLMRGIRHEWRAVAPLACCFGAGRAKV